MKKKENKIQKLLLTSVLFLAILCGLSLTSHSVWAKGTNQVRYQTSNGRFYLYRATGKQISEEGIYTIPKQTVHGKTFDGIYAVSQYGYLYIGTGICYTPEKTVQGIDYAAGFYFLDRGGKFSHLRRSGEVKKRTIHGQIFEGYYCFAGKNGRLIQKKGLVSTEATYYYLTDSQGKCLTNEKKTIDGFTYSFQSDGAGVRTNTKMTSLKTKLNKKVKGYGGTWSIYVKRLDNSDSFVINDKPIYAASLIKTFVMASTFQQIQKGTIKETKTMDYLLNTMITVSENESCNELVKRQTGIYSFAKGRSVINSYMKEQSYTETELHHTLHPSGSPFITDGKRNQTSVSDCGRLLESIYRGTCVDSQKSKKMLNYLLAQQRRWKIPAGLPKGTKVANKTGETSSCEHDIAIVYSPKCTYILCVMSQNSSNACNRISDISRTVYQYFN